VQKASLIESEGGEEGQAQWWCGLVPLNRGGLLRSGGDYCATVGGAFNPVDNIPLVEAACYGDVSI
jgi:hypothetical protein